MARNNKKERNLISRSRLQSAENTKVRSTLSTEINQILKE